MDQLAEAKESNVTLIADLGEGGDSSFLFFLSKRVSPALFGKQMEKGLAQARICLVTFCKATSVQAV